MRIAKALAVLAGGACLASCAGPTQPRAGGVVFQGAELGQYAGVLAEAGQKVVFGATVVENAGSSAATLTEGRLVGAVASDEAEVVEVRARLLRADDGELVGAALWPFEDYALKSVPLAGFELAPGAEAELLYVVEVRQTGVWNWPAASVTYTSDDRSHEASASTGLQICPPKGDCPPLEDSIAQEPPDADG